MQRNLHKQGSKHCSKLSFCFIYRNALTQIRSILCSVHISNKQAIYFTVCSFYLFKDRGIEWQYRNEYCAHRGRHVLGLKTGPFSTHCRVTTLRKRRESLSPKLFCHLPPWHSPLCCHDRVRKGFWTRHKVETSGDTRGSFQMHVMVGYCTD